MQRFGHIPSSGIWEGCSEMCMSYFIFLLFLLFLRRKNTSAPRKMSNPQRVPSGWENNNFQLAKKKFGFIQWEAPRCLHRLNGQNIVSLNYSAQQIIYTCKAFCIHTCVSCAQTDPDSRGFEGVKRIHNVSILHSVFMLTINWAREGYLSGLLCAVRSHIISVQILHYCSSPYSWVLKMMLIWWNLTFAVMLAG